MSIMASKVYSRVRAIIMYFGHHADQDMFLDQQNESMEHTLNSLGVDTCERIDIQEDSPRGDSGPWLQQQLQRFKNESVEDDELHVIYYAGHGGLKNDGETLLAASRSQNGQFFEWNDALWDTLLGGPHDMLVILNCCNAGVTLQSRYPGAKEVFAAVPADRSTPAHGDDSFSNALTEAAKSLDHKGFTASDWIAEAAIRMKGIQPVLQSLGTSSRQILFTPRAWLERRGSSGEEDGEERDEDDEDDGDEDED